MSVFISGVTRVLPLLLVAWTLTGCRRDEIQTYRVPKEASAPDTPMQAMPGMTPAGSTQDITWKAPSGWEEKPASSMRVGSFLIKGPGGESVDISVIPLAGDVGGLLANLNRWRGQIGLKPIAASELGKNITHTSMGGRAMTWVDFVNAGQRLTIAIYNKDGRQWFFKMSGPDALVRATQPAFKQFLSSLRFTNHE